jgi:formate hydrogenlyase subunit 3/multisubunit Na+/H+ antiporter MnhD subunit
LDKILLVPIFAPLIVGFLLLFVPGTLKPLHKLLALAGAVVAFALAIKIFAAPAELAYSWSILQIDGFNLELLLRTSHLRSFVLLFAMGFGFLISLYTLKAEPAAESSNMFYGSLLLTIGGSAGVLLSNHLLFLLIFWEIVTVSLYLLIMTGGKSCSFAATKSFAMIGFSDAAFLLGIGMVWALSGTFVISEISVVTTSAAAIGAFLLLMTAAITKAGALPLHTWLPTSGESAPASIMAILPASLDKLLGIYLLVVIVSEMFVLESGALSVILALIGSATIIIAVMVAMVQHNVKKLLSYHAISQVGYMILGIATMTPVGIAGGVFHMLNNAIYKCCLFLCGGAVEEATGTVELDELGGLGNKMPFTFVACLIAALSISGVPPFNGFVSKWMIYQGVIKMGAAGSMMGGKSLWPVWLTAAMFGSALTLASFVKIIHSIFLSRMPSDKKDVKEVSGLMLVPMGVLAVLCILFGVFYRVPLNVFIYPALNIKPETVIFGTWDSALATGFILIGLLLGGGLLILGLVARKSRTVRTWTCGEIMDNDEMRVSGTHFYKTISEMSGFKQLYERQERKWFDLYNIGGSLGLAFSRFLSWLHSGLLPMYMTWVILGLLIILTVFGRIW